MCLFYFNFCIKAIKTFKAKKNIIIKIKFGITCGIFLMFYGTSQYEKNCLLRYIQLNFQISPEMCAIYSDSPGNIGTMHSTGNF